MSIMRNARLCRSMAACLGPPGCLYVLDHGEPGEQREALKDDRDMWNLAPQGLAVPENLTRGRRGQSVRMRNSVDFPEPDGPSSAIIFPERTSRLVGAIT